MRLVRALLLAEVALTISPWRGRLARTVFRPEALHRGPGIDQRTIHREVLARQKLLHLRQPQQRRQKLVRHLRLQQAVAVMREHGGMPDLRIYWQADKPAEQQIVIDLLHQHPLGAYGEESLQQRRPQQHLRWDRWTTHRGIKALKSLVQREQGLIGQPLDRSQRMIRRDAFFQSYIREKPLRSII